MGRFNLTPGIVWSRGILRPATPIQFSLVAAMWTVLNNIFAGAHADKAIKYFIASMLTLHNILIPMVCLYAAVFYNHFDEQPWHFGG